MDTIAQIMNFLMSFEYFLPICIGAVGLVIVLQIISRFATKKKSSSRSLRKEDSDTLCWDDDSYKNSILCALSVDDRPDYSYLYDSVDEIYRLANLYRNTLDDQKINAAASIEQKIEQSQHRIQRKWSQVRGNQAYHHYIALHYASFTLADHIKREQEILRDAYVDAKTKCDAISSQIETLNALIPTAHGSRRYEFMQQHKQLCTRHQHMSQLKNVFAKRNTEYLQMVKKQNKVTKEYREFIIHSFGKRGRAWGSRLRQRKLDQIS